MPRPAIAPDSPAARVRAAREAAGLSLEQLAGRLGVSKGRVHAIERGKPATLDTLWRLAGALRCRASDLDDRLARRVPEPSPSPG